MGHPLPRQQPRDEDGPPRTGIPARPQVPSFEPAWTPLDRPRTPFSPRDWSAFSHSLVARAPGDSSNVSGQPEDILGVVEVDHLPELEGDLQPHYPEMLRRAGVSGEVQLEYVVQESGLVDRNSVVVLATTHPAFSQAAREALHRARFKPARRAARPVAVLVRQTIRFLSH